MKVKSIFTLKFLVLLIFMLLTLLQSGSAAAGASTFTVSQSYPVEFLMYVPCAAGGQGEVVALTGSLHYVISGTFTPGGSFKGFDSANPQNLHGLGLTTGDRYRGTGISRVVTTGKVGFEDTYVNNFRIIGQGNGNNFLLHENFHFTVNPNGTVTVFHDNLKVVCK